MTKVDLALDGLGIRYTQAPLSCHNITRFLPVGGKASQHFARLFASAATTGLTGIDRFLATFCLQKKIFYESFDPQNIFSGHTKGFRNKTLWSQTSGGFVFLHHSKFKRSYGSKRYLPRSKQCHTRVKSNLVDFIANLGPHSI